MRVKPIRRLGFGLLAFALAGKAHAVCRLVSLNAVGGDGQSGAPLQIVPQLLSVQVNTYNTALPLAGVGVFFSIDSAPDMSVDPFGFALLIDPADGSQFGQGTVFTDANGVASVQLQLGSSTGPYTISAGVYCNNPAIFTETAVQTRAARFLSVFAGGNPIQIEVVGSTLPVPMTVIVKDSSGTAVPNTGVNFSTSAAPVGAVGQGFESSDAMTRADGKASAVFRLGNVPADYQIRCDCASCVPEASSVPFRACGKLRSDDLKQYDVAWSTHSYDDRCHLTGSTVPFNCSPQSPPRNSVPFTIRQRGCAMSAMADVINYYHDRYSLTYATTTPSELNQYLRNNVGFSRGDVDFRRIGNYTASGRIVCYGGSTELGSTTFDALLNRIDTNLTQGNPVILRIPSATNPAHFVVAIGKCMGKYLIADPGHDRASIDPEQILGIREFALTTGSVCPKTP